MNNLRTEFRSELDDLRNSVARLGASVVELIPRATHILLQQDLEGAEYLLRADTAIDERAFNVEEQALNMLALQAPVAADLRHVAAALKLAPEIERSGDLCANLCKAARRIYGHELDPKLRGIIQRLSDQAHKEYKEVVESYLANDPARASAIVDMDDMLDDIHQEFIQQIFQSHAAEAMELQVAVQLAMVARFYERLGDHAVNISKRVVYIATGELPEHDRSGRSQMQSADHGVVEGPVEAIDE